MLLAAIVTAFVAFTGVAALVPGGLAEPGGAAAGGQTLTEGWLVVLAVDDALIALLLGYRLGPVPVRDGGGRGVVRADVRDRRRDGGGRLRAMEIPRLLGPALLTLVFYLWDALHAAAPARRREPRFLWEIALLVVLGAVVVVWNLQLRA